MSDDLHAENSDVTEVTIEADETPRPLAQLNEFKETYPIKIKTFKEKKNLSSNPIF